MTEAMSETQVSVGTMTSPGPKVSRSAVIVRRLADAPEFTKTLCLTPSHSDHSFSNNRTCCDCVSIGLSCRKYSITASKSARVMLFCISGQSSVSGVAAFGLPFGLLLVVIVAIFDHDGALPVVSLQRPLVGRKNVFRFIQTNHLN